MKKLFKTNEPKYCCPYCSYATGTYGEMYDHLTYYHYMSTPGVDMVMKELYKEKNMACGEPAGCHYTKEEMAKKREFAAKVMKTIAVVSLICVILYYV